MDEQNELQNPDPQGAQAPSSADLDVHQAEVQAAAETETPTQPPYGYGQAAGFNPETQKNSQPPAEDGSQPWQPPATRRVLASETPTPAEDELPEAGQSHPTRLSDEEVAAQQGVFDQIDRIEARLERIEGKLDQVLENQAPGARTDRKVPYTSPSLPTGLTPNQIINHPQVNAPAEQADTE